VRWRPISIFLITAVALAAFVGWAAFRAIRTPEPHRVILHWNPSKPTAGVTVTGYNVYRSTTPGGPYVKLAPLVADPTYTDWLVTSGRTYYYVVTAVDSVGHESNYSEAAVAAIP
jgi:fibronectin type 3 domain-containing protein